MLSSDLLPAVQMISDWLSKMANDRWRDVITSGDSKTAPLRMYKHSIVYGVSLITTESMPVVCVCDLCSYDITPFAM